MKSLINLTKKLRKKYFYRNNNLKKSTLYSLIQHFEKVRKKEKIDVNGLNFLEFGTGINSANMIHDCLDYYYNFDNPHTNKVVMFDHFKSDTDDESSNAVKIGLEEFKKSLSKRLETLNSNESVRRYISETCEFRDGDIQITSKDYLENNSFFGIISIDLGKYSFDSVFTVLDNLKEKLKSWTIIIFDDTAAFAGNPSKGALGAINKFNNENKNCGLSEIQNLDNKYNNNKVYPELICYYWKN